MRTLTISTSDIGGGAARAAYRLHQGLQQLNVGSSILVRDQLSDDGLVNSDQSGWAKLNVKLKIAEKLDALPSKLYRRKSRTPISAEWLPDRLADKVQQANPDIINLHWACKGFLKIETLAKFTQPIVWTLHDMWAFTGGCHYSEDCDRYTKSCGTCPQLESDREQDLSRWIWKRKAKAWESVNLTVVSPSKWLAECARSSPLLQNRRIEVIPNGLDTQIYQPIERHLARARLKLPQDKLLILFGAMSSTSDRRKGFHLLQPALQKLGTSDWRDRVELVVFGSSRPKSEPNFGFKTHYLGSLSDDFALSLVYAAADVFVAPSVQENLPNTVMEALACGTPCVAFKIGGMPDLIEHQLNGYLAYPFEIEDLANGIKWVLADKEQHSLLRINAREKVEQEFTLAHQARQYVQLFEELIES